MGAFQWTKKAEAAALALANGETREQAALIAQIAESTLYRWLQIPEFSEEVDNLTLITGIARKAERVRIAKRIARRLDETTEKDLLDWLKYVQSATEGIRLGLAPELAALLKNAGLLAGSGSGRITDPEPSVGDLTEL